MATLIAYALTVAAVAFSVTSLPQVLVGGLIARWAGILFGALVGGVLSWSAINLMWLWLEGNHIPIAALGAAVVTLFVHSFISRNNLSQQSLWLMAGEIWAIVLLAIYLVVFSDEIRWV